VPTARQRVACLDPKNMGKLLVIEDDFSLRDLLRVHLSALGHHVRVAADAAEAIRTILVQTPDLILLDINMPYLNGFELLEALRGDELTQAVPVIVLTARSDDESYARARQLGATHYITKPVQLDDLISAIDSAL
jgi:DNA-binding response OmpR family regulator